ncbi:MAG: hypothetical protein ACRCZE_00520 [Candidatus Altimarinota bacterium]
MKNLSSMVGGAALVGMGVLGCREDVETGVKYLEEQMKEADHTERDQLEEMALQNLGKIQSLIEGHGGKENAQVAECIKEEKTCEQSMEKTEACKFLAEGVNPAQFYTLHRKFVDANDDDAGVEVCMNDIRKALNECQGEEIDCLEGK